MAESETMRIATPLGDIALASEGSGSGIPLVFMHGVFLDRTLWADYGSVQTGRRHVYVDMPAHGESGNVGRDWRLEECADMLIALLDALGIDRCIAVGQSWGSMTALRAAVRHPWRFAALGLFNMPFERQTGLGRLGFMLQKRFLGWPRFYARQAANSLYSAELLRRRPELSEAMQARLAARPRAEIARVIDAVILDAEDARPLLASLRVPALALRGETDYVAVPPGLACRTVPGGHVSPHEAVDATRQAIARLLELAEASGH